MNWLFSGTITETHGRFPGKIRQEAAKCRMFGQPRGPTCPDDGLVISKEDKELQGWS